MDRLRVLWGKWKCFIGRHDWTEWVETDYLDVLEKVAVLSSVEQKECLKCGKMDFKPLGGELWH